MNEDLASKTHENLSASSKRSVRPESLGKSIEMSGAGNDNLLFKVW